MAGGHKMKAFQKRKILNAILIANDQMTNGKVNLNMV
jgi:hypothetical protein